jgi:multiple sugar transport system substrate-binding protein
MLAKVNKRPPGAKKSAPKKEGATQVRTRWIAAWASTAAVFTLLVGCTTTTQPEDKPSPTTAIKMTLGVYGAPTELSAYADIVEAWNLDNPNKQLILVTAADEAEQSTMLRSGRQAPDVFLASRSDLDYLVESKINQPVGALLDEPNRDVDLGDGYPIDSVRAFAAEDELQCMPYGYSPMVMYYNTKLINFARMKRRGLDVPGLPGRWTFDEFSEAAKFAARPATRSAGLHIDSTLSALAPFVYAGGGQVFDDSVTPTSVNFSDDDSQAALTAILELLRNPPSVTLSYKQLAKQSPLEWFKAGKLGMFAGYRSLTPELRKTPGLAFDVMALPRIADEQTVGDITGLCMSADAQETDVAADLIFYLSGKDPVSKITEAGFMVPANLGVAASDAFLQPGREPFTASVFNGSTRNIVLPPLLDGYAELESAVSFNIRRLFSMGTLDLPAVTAEIDADSQAFLSPTESSESPES